MERRILRIASLVAFAADLNASKFLRYGSGIVAACGNAGRASMDWPITDCRRSCMVSPEIMPCCAQYAHKFEKSVSVNV